MFLTEFDEEKYIAMVKRESKEEGIEEGIERGKEEGIEEGIERGIEQEKVHSLKILTQIIKLPTKQAMMLLEIPEDEQGKYLKALL